MSQFRFRCPVCGEPTPDGNPVWVAGFVVVNDELEDEAHFDRLKDAQEEAAEIGSQVQLDLSDGCRTPDLTKVPFAPF